MRNLYRSLFTYKQKPDRSPLEEFTSGALADLLSRLDRSGLERFLGIFRAQDGQACISSKLLADEELYWDAEHSVWSEDSKWGRADLIALRDKSPCIIIENKISASVSDTQLGLYHSALAKSAIPNCALLFLTHTTAPPADFFSRQDAEGVARGLARWSDVYSFLRVSAKDPDADSAYRSLATEFADFLKLKELHMEVMTLEDLSVLRLYLSSTSRMNNTLRTAFDPICGKLSPWRKGTRGDTFDETDGHYIYEASYRADGKDHWGLFAVGIVFPELTDWWGTDENSSPQLTVYLYDNDEQPLPKYNLPGWRRSKEGDQYAFTSDLHKILGDETNSSLSLAKWANDRGEEIVKALSEFPPHP